MLQSKRSGVEASRGSVLSAQSMRKQDITALTLTGRVGSMLHSSRSGIANYEQPGAQHCGVLKPNIDSLCQIWLTAITHGPVTLA